jgi:hypothetical protein
VTRGNCESFTIRTYNSEASRRLGAQVAVQIIIHFAGSLGSCIPVTPSLPPRWGSLGGLGPNGFALAGYVHARSKVNMRCTENGRLEDIGWCL